MISKCPHCKKDIKLSDAHKTKLKAAYSKLTPDKSIKFKCPVCKKNIELKGRKGADPAKKAPKKEAALTPKKQAEKPKAETPKAKDDSAPKPVNPPPDPPKAPDISWLESGSMDEKSVIEDVPTAVIMMPEGKAKEIVSKVMAEELKYQLFNPKDVAEVIDSMRFKDFEAMVFHPEFEGKPIKESELHNHIRNLPMSKRRYMHYTLIGPDFHTLYDLEALAYSANLVINDKNVGRFSIIIKKGMADYKELFDPFIKFLKAHGKR